MDRQLLGPETLAQLSDEIAVEFYNVQVRDALEQGDGQRALPGSDFDHPVTRLRRDGSDNTLDDGLVGQEVLAETLARSMGRRHKRSSIAKRADIQLALPLAW